MVRPLGRQLEGLLPETVWVRRATEQCLLRARARCLLAGPPVLRTLLKVKRKSRPDVDEQQDGAWVSRCSLDGSGLNLVILEFVERTHPGTEQGDASPPIHCALEHFQPVDLPFGLAVAPRLTNGIAHCVDIGT